MGGCDCIFNAKSRSIDDCCVWDGKIEDGGVGKTGTGGKLFTRFTMVDCAFAFVTVIELDEAIERGNTLELDDAIERGNALELDDAFWLGNTLELDDAFWLGNTLELGDAVELDDVKSTMSASSATLSPLNLLHDSFKLLLLISTWEFWFRNGSSSSDISSL